jgi:hypothetical protein
MPYAVNLSDWQAQASDPGLKVLLSPVVSKVPEVCERDQLCGLGLVLDCGEERAAAIVQFARKRYQPHQLRFYRGQGKTWKRI